MRAGAAIKLLVCTSNQPRHVTLVNRLIREGHNVVTIVEPKTYQDNPKYGKYWTYVREAELDVFGAAYFMAGRTMALKPGELSALAAPVFLEDRLPVIFSASYITTPLIDHFVARGAVNLHVGIAPEYRGSAPNFWALYDKNDHLVGAQVQRLSRTLDAGDILAETRGIDLRRDPFRRGMLAAARGIDLLCDLLQRSEPWQPARPNDPALQIRYSKHADFTPEVADEFLERYGL